SPAVSSWSLDSVGGFLSDSGGGDPAPWAALRGGGSVPGPLPPSGPAQARFITAVCPKRCLCQCGEPSGRSHPRAERCFLAALTLLGSTPNVSDTQDALQVPLGRPSPFR